jgi:hypothetical protein|nr:MAG TPA: hypothetical protein [Caudoviricetes sp.]
MISSVDSGFIKFFSFVSHYRVYWRNKKKITKHYQT